MLSVPLGLDTQLAMASSRERCSWQGVAYAVFEIKVCISIQMEEKRNKSHSYRHGLREQSQHFISQPAALSVSAVIPAQGASQLVSTGQWLTDCSQ
jgi:hypothetical protein